MAVRRIAAHLGIVALLALSPGCFFFTSKHKGEELRKDVDDIDDRLAAQETTLQSKIAELEEVLEKATKLLQRNSADLGADVTALVEENAKLTGLVMDAKRLVGELRTEIQDAKAGYEARFNELDSRLQALEDKANQPPPKSASDTYSDAKKALRDGKFQDARVGFSTFIRKWPGHDLADDAMYYWGEGHYKDGNYEKAVAVYQKVFDEYSKSEWADDALYSAGQAAEKLKWCTDALAYYTVLQQKYPKSSLKKKAARRVRYLKRNRKNRKTCRS